MPVELNTALVIAKRCGISTLSLIPILLVLLLAGAHRALHTALQLQGACPLGLADADAQRLLDVVFIAGLGHASRSLLRVHVDRRVVAHDGATLLS